MICERVEYEKQMDYCLWFFDMVFVHLILFGDHFGIIVRFRGFLDAEIGLALNDFDYGYGNMAFKWICEKAHLVNLMFNTRTHNLRLIK